MSEMNFKVPSSWLAIAIKLNTIPTKKEIKLKSTISSEKPSSTLFNPNNKSPIIIKPIDHLLNRFIFSPPNRKRQSSNHLELFIPDLIYLHF